ncbi:MAG: TetR/AcrR family transcriptional regulator [Kordiimonadaceae bacterium]|nr:TetR/AcrR family transcriptional regulator [Kordiimonadaceae bacterium]
MPRIAKHSKSALTDILEPVFLSYGYDGASLGMLSEAAGVSKASLYHHFSNGKQDMAAAVLNRSGTHLQQLVLAPLLATGPSVGRLLQSYEGVAAYYSGTVPACLMNSFLLGQGAKLFGQRISLAVGAWQKALENAYSELQKDRVLSSGVIDADSEDEDAAPNKARAVLQQIQGALVLCRVTNSRAPLESSLKGLCAELA